MFLASSEGVNLSRNKVHLARREGGVYLAWIKVYLDRGEKGLLG